MDLTVQVRKKQNTTKQNKLKHFNGKVFNVKSWLSRLYVAERVPCCIFFLFFLSAIAVSPFQDQDMPVAFLSYFFVYNRCTLLSRTGLKSKQTTRLCS